MKRTICTNERGNRVGESHPNAKLTDAQVAQLLALREEGWSYGRLAAVFEVSKSAVRWYCIGGRRCQLVMGVKVVHVTPA